MTTSAVLCIHRDPAQLTLLTEHGYEVATATTGSDGLRLFMSKSFDAVVLEYHLGLIDGVAVAQAIKLVRPQVPVIMVADNVRLPSDALKSVDALVANSDGPHFLLATVHFVLQVNALNVKPVAAQKKRLKSSAPTHLRRPGRSRETANRGQFEVAQLAIDGKDSAFSPEVWESIRAGKICF